MEDSEVSETRHWNCDARSICGDCLFGGAIDCDR